MFLAEFIVTIASAATSIGWLHGNCFAVNNADLVAGTNLTIVSLEKKQRIINAKIIRKTEDGSECHALLSDRKSINLKGGTNFYTVSSNNLIEFGIGAISEKQLQNLNGDDPKNTFHHCSTSEGMQFSIWNGAAHNSNLVWSGYYYLGYDTPITCPPLPITD